MKGTELCVVCAVRPRAGLLLCGPCGRSYDRARDKDVTVAAAIVWAAKRSRRFAVVRRTCGTCGYWVDASLAAEPGAGWCDKAEMWTDRTEGCLEWTKGDEP